MAEQTFKEFLGASTISVKALLFAILFAACGIIFSAWFSVSKIWKYYQGPSLTESILLNSRKKATVIPEFTHTYEIKDMSVGFMNRKATRTAYAQFTLIFDCPTEACKTNMTMQRAKVLDVIFEVGGDFYIEDFTAPLAVAGFANFKLRIREALKKSFASHAPRDVVFKEWFMN